jgi:hypothetical protein
MKPYELLFRNQSRSTGGYEVSQRSGSSIVELTMLITEIFAYWNLWVIYHGLHSIYTHSKHKWHLSLTYNGLHSNILNGWARASTQGTSHCDFHILGWSWGQCYSLALSSTYLIIKIYSTWCKTGKVALHMGQWNFVAVLKLSYFDYHIAIWIAWSECSFPETLKVECHKIFDPRFFSLNCIPGSPDLWAKTYAYRFEFAELFD